MRRPICGGVAGAIWIASSPALAYHNTAGGGGGAPLDVILPIVGFVALGMVALTIWGRKTRKVSKGRKRKRRGKSVGRKQG